MFCIFLLFDGSRVPRMASYSGHCCTLPQSFPKKNKQTKTDKLTKYLCIILQNSQQPRQSQNRTLVLKQGLNSKGCGGEIGFHWLMGTFSPLPWKKFFWTLPSLRRPQERIQVGLMASLPTTLNEAYRNIILDCSIREVLNNQSQGHGYWAYIFPCHLQGLLTNSHVSQIIYHISFLVLNRCTGSAHKIPGVPTGSPLEVFISKSPETYKRNKCP